MKKSKKIKLLLLSMGILGITVPSTMFLSSCFWELTPSDEKNNFKNSNNTVFDVLENDIDNPRGELSSFNSYNESIKEEKTRQVQNEYYTSSLGDSFKYPGYNYNYEDKKNNIDQTTNDKVMNETVEIANDPTNFKYKYSDAQWISSQIYDTTVTNTNNKRVVEYGNKKTTSELKKHKAVDNFYIENVKNDQPSITKDIEISTNISGISHIGLYAPAGEIIKIRFSDETFQWMQENQINPIDIIINNSYWNNRAFNDSGRISNRYPYLKTTFNQNSGFDWKKQEFYFGSPFGGSIAINIKNTILPTSSLGWMPHKSMNISFSVSGAVEELFYSHDYTTEQQWNDQINRVKQNKITSPMFSVNSSFFSFSVPFTSQEDPKSNTNPKAIIKKIAGLNIDTIDYPKKQFDKWFDFFSISYYFSSKDKNNSKKINMMFCDDIWGNTDGWGGGYEISAPLSWSNAFYNSLNQINISDSWSLFQKINNNFQQDTAFFKKRTNGQANQISMIIYSLIANGGRYRSELRPYGIENVNYEWSKLSNSFYNINKILKSNQSDEYSLYANLLYSFGPYMYMDYVRKDVVEHPNNVPTWTGISEIIRLSHYFKLNLYPAFQSYTQYWENWTDPTISETDELKKINEQYPSFDFVGNLYASGSYLYQYDNPKNKFVYTQDYTAPYEIEAGKPYIFDFENNINSTNKNFTWDEIKIEKSVTKNGGKLEIDPTNKKRLIYTPKNGSYDVDEFDVSIIPTSKIYHVPEYKWKIKVKQTIFGGYVENYDLRNLNETDDTILMDKFSKYNSIDNSSEYLSGGYTNYLSKGSFITNQKEGIKISAQFVPKETGTYSFNLKWDDRIKFIISDPNDKKSLITFNSNNFTSEFKYTDSINLEKGKKYNLDVFVINNSGIGNFEMKSYLNNKEFEISDICLLPNADIISGVSDLNVLIDDPKYKYQSRKFNYLYLPSIFDKYLKKLPNIFVDSNQYTFESNDSQRELENLKKPGNTFWEVWRRTNKFFPIELSINYNSLTDVSGIVLSHRTNNWAEKRPHFIDIYGYDGSSDHGKLIYSDFYGSQNNDKTNSDVVINFDKTHSVKKIKIVFNSKNLEEDKNSDCISLTAVQSLKYPYYKLNSLITFQDMKISTNSVWEYLENGKIYDQVNKWGYSLLNGRSLYTITKGSIISFDTESNGFAIVGNLLKKANSANNNIEYELPEFEIYINDIKYIFDPSIVNKSESTALFYYSSLKKQKMNVKIVYKGGGPLIIDYISTYGDGYSTINK